MATEVIWSDHAKQDIEKIRSEIGNEFVRELLSAIHTMSFHVWDGKIIPEYGIQSLREIQVEEYLIFYQILLKPEGMEILAVRHQSIRDLS